MTRIPHMQRRRRVAIAALAALTALPVLTYATYSPTCMPERILAIRLIGRNAEVRCGHDLRSVHIPTPGGMIRASRNGTGWLVITTSNSYQVADMDGIRSILNGDIPEGAVAIKSDPEVGP